MNRLLLLCFLGVGQARAATFDFDDAAMKEAGIDPEALRSDLDAKIDEKLRAGDQPRFLAGMANAATISARGMGVDYGLDVKKFVAGVGVGSGVAYEGTLFGRDEDEVLPVGGFSAQLSLMAGVCPGGFVPGDDFFDHVRVFVHGMTLEMPSNHVFSGSLRNLGGNLQLQLFDGADAKVAAWNGLALTAGYSSTLFRLRLEGDVPVEVTEDGADVRWDATGSYDIDARAGSIPLEVSTAVRVFVVGVYVGGGYDIVTASADRTAALSGPVELTDSGEERSLGTATLSLEDSADGDAGMLRGFGGVQVRLWFVKVIGQLNIADNDTIGGHVGVRVAW